MPTLNIKSTQQAIKVGEHKGEEMFVMKVEHYNTMDAEKIIDYAAETYCIPRGMLRASWEAIGQVVSTWALEGHIVEIPGLGNIRAEVLPYGQAQAERAKAQKEAKDVSIDDVFRRKLLLTPTKAIKDQLNATTLDITCFDMDGREVKRNVNQED